MPQERTGYSAPILAPLKYKSFPLGVIKPNGWFAEQIHHSGHGLAGHLFYFYRFVKDSTWLGGTCEYSGLNESAPHWYNYIVPLAYTVDRLLERDLAESLISQANEFLIHLLENQSEDGWLGPEKTRETRGIWARCLLLQGMMNHARADSAQRHIILTAMLRFSTLVHKMLLDNYTGYIPIDGDVFDLQWFGVARAHELSTTLQWLYEEVDSTSEKKILWEIMELMWSGARKAGRDWNVFFDPVNFPQTPAVRGKSTNFEHGVNVAQGLRYPAQEYRMYPSAALDRLSHEAVKLAFKYHGTPAGSLSSDEYLGGLSPQRGSELCCSVEIIFSLVYLHGLFGDNDFMDRAEMTAFNAFPAGIADDWWSHQYVTQINQPWAREIDLQPGEKSPFYDVSGFANVFGLEPEFPCCTVNHPTAYPKLLMNAYQSIESDLSKRGRESIVHNCLIPSRLEIEGLAISCETEYPFVHALKYTLSTDRELDFHIRIPSWADDSSTVSLSKDGNKLTKRPLKSIRPAKGGIALHKVTIPRNGTYIIDVSLSSPVQIKILEGNTACIYWGALLFAYEIPFKSKSRMPRNYKDQRSNCEEVDKPSHIRGRKWMENIRDYDYFPTAIWNVAIDPNEPAVLKQRPEQDGKSYSSNSIWASHAAPCRIEVTVVEIEWLEKNGTAADPKDVIPVPIGKPFRVELVPYGSAKLHIAQFPIVGSAQKQQQDEQQRHQQQQRSMIRKLWE